MSEIPLVSLQLLGAPRLVVRDGFEARLPDRAAALLAYLALEGPTLRARLAGLLWPNASDATARNNLAQTLRRLARVSGEVPVVTGRDRIQLAANVSTDVLAYVVAHHEGRLPESVFAPGGPLLGDLAFDESEALAEWLLAARFRIDRLRSAAAHQLADRAEALGRLDLAVEHTEAAVEIEPHSEAAWRRLMQLRYESGDRGAALATFARCRDRLVRDVDAEPSPETLRLAERIRNDDGSPRRDPVPIRRTLPRSVLRPPRLLGREAEWALMEEAWSRGAAIFLTGAPGVGKTRLLREFLASKGRCFVFEGRPEDGPVPYATHARTYRQMLEYFPALALPDWVERELARLMPERGPAPEGEPVPLRFLQAQAEATRLAVELGMHHVGVDDLQFVDFESLVAGHFVYAPHWGRVDGMRTVLCFRDGTLRSEAQSMLDEALATQSAVLLRLTPLAERDAAALVESLGVGLDAQADDLARRSEGNPLFLLEMVRSVLELGGGPHSQASFALPARVRQLVAARLERLRPEARDLLRVAALAGERFDAALAARVLDVPLIRLSEPWTELEAAQVLHGERFAHDLVMEVARETIPTALRARLERRIDAAAAALAHGD